MVDIYSGGKGNIFEIVLPGKVWLNDRWLLTAGFWGGSLVAHGGAPESRRWHARVSQGIYVNHDMKEFFNINIIFSWLIVISNFWNQMAVL